MYKALDVMTIITMIVFLAFLIHAIRVIMLEPNVQIDTTPYLYSLGDMNLDGQINITDLSILSAQINAQHE